jgi:integrase
MARSRQRHSTYIFQRPGSQNWWVRLRSPRKTTVQSLGTPDKDQAMIVAGPMVTAHRAALASARPHVETAWALQYQPGLHTGLNGERIFATPTELHYLDTQGQTLSTEPNGFIGRRLVGRAMPAAQEFGAFDAAEMERPVKTDPQGDDAIIEDYLSFKNTVGYPRREAETTWQLFRTLTKGKPLVKCGWDEGRALVAHYAAQGLKTASIHKRLVRLNAAVNHAIKKTGKLPRDFANPFSAVVAKEGDDSTERVALDDADLKACAANLHKLSAHDQLLFRVLCTTGLRLNEAFQIAGEKTLKGIRFCEVVSRKGREGKKPLLRRVPFPAHLIRQGSGFPSAVKGPLFSGTTNDASKRINNWLHDVCGITEKDANGKYTKTLHSLRHRAIGLLDEAECPDNVSRRLFGHAQDEHEKYSKVIVVLKKWIDKIDGI